MDLLRPFRRGGVETLVPPTDTTAVLVPVAGNEVDEQVVRVACSILKRKPSRLILLHVVEVPRSQPLDVTVNMQTPQRILDTATEVAARLGFPVQAEVIQARDAGVTIVEEAVNLKADTILMGLPVREKLGTPSLGHTVPYVLLHAPCRVVVVRPAVTPEPAE